MAVSACPCGRAISCILASDHPPPLPAPLPPLPPPSLHNAQAYEFEMLVVEKRDLAKALAKSKVVNTTLADKLTRLELALAKK